MCHQRVLPLQRQVNTWSAWHVGSFNCSLWSFLSWHQCKGTRWEVVDDVKHYMSGFPPTSKAVNTKAVTSVPSSTLLASVIKWSLASDVVPCLAPIAWLLEGMSFCSVTDLFCGLLSCNLLALQPTCQPGWGLQAPYMDMVLAQHSWMASSQCQDDIISKTYDWLINIAKGNIIVVWGWYYVYGLWFVSFESLAMFG